MNRTIRPVGDDEWELVAWLWQAYRSDLAPIVRGLPYADGRYAHGPLDGYPGPDRAAYLAWQPHPNTAAEGFWRRVATDQFGPEGEAWTEEERPVPGKPEVPPDHWIETAL